MTAGKFPESLSESPLTDRITRDSVGRMRIKRSVTRFFMALILPALTIAVVGYFGSYAIWGERGLLKLEDAEAHLGMQQEKLAQLTAEHDRLAHRIQLMEDGHADPDLVEELARGQLMDGAPNQVAVPRTAH